MSRLSKAIHKVNEKLGFSSGRIWVLTDDVIKKFPHGIHITGIDKNNKDGVDRYHITYVEEPQNIFSLGGVAVRQEMSALFDEYGGDLVALNEDLKKDYLKAIISMRSNINNNRAYYTIAFLGEVPASHFGGVVTDEKGAKIDTETGEVISDGAEEVKFNEDLPF